MTREQKIISKEVKLYIPIYLYKFSPSDLSSMKPYPNSVRQHGISLFLSYQIISPAVYIALTPLH